MTLGKSENQRSNNSWLRLEYKGGNGASSSRGQGSKRRGKGILFVINATGEPRTSMPKMEARVIYKLLLLLLLWFKYFTWALVKPLSNSLIELTKVNFRLINAKF